MNQSVGLIKDLDLVNVDMKSEGTTRPNTTASTEIAQIGEEEKNAKIRSIKGESEPVTET